MSLRFASRVVTLLGFIGLTVLPLHGTAQTPDVITLEGKEYALLVNPLETYISQNPQRRPSREVLSTANWRGYVAHFAVVDRELFVRDVRVSARAPGGERSVLSEVFGASVRLVATWFTGNLIIPDGKKISHVDMGYGSEYENYILIRVNAGVTVSPRRLNQQEFAELRQAQFEAFRQTENYREAVTKARQDSSLSPEDAERFIFHYASADYMARIF